MNEHHTDLFRLDLVADNAPEYVEKAFSQLDDQFMMVRNYAKQTCGLFARIAAKVAALTILQYIIFCNKRPISHVKSALF